MTPVAMAKVSGSKHLATGLVEVLSTTSLNAAASARTFTWGKNAAIGYAYAIFWVEFTHANNGAITVDCTASNDKNATDYETGVCTMSGATCTLALDAQFVTATLTADTNYMFPWGILGARDFECVVSHDGTPAAGDTVRIQAQLIAQ
jgi:hypothetical protein